MIKPASVQDTAEEMDTQSVKNENKQSIRIHDDLTSLKLSRQRKYQIRHMRAGLCIECGREAHAGTLYCVVHNAKRGIKQAGKNGQRLRIWVDILSPSHA